MRKLKKQAEDAKARKIQVKKDKGWVGGSTIPREVPSTKTSSSKTTMIDTSGGKQQQSDRVVGGFDFEALD